MVPLELVVTWMLYIASHKIKKILLFLKGATAMLFSVFTHGCLQPLTNTNKILSYLRSFISRKEKIKLFPDLFAAV
jgi:hypothetical protein